MKEIKPKSAPGPDDIPAYIYNTFAEELALPIMKIWRISLDKGIMPEGTLFSVIVPLYKGGDKADPPNYRPLALTNHLTKVFERVLRLSIIKHLETNNFMNPTQHGFRSRHSTITQLLNYYDSVLSILEQGHCPNTVYLDFAKAFDKVDHQILLSKVHKLGIQGKVHTWIKEFLTNRQQSVRVEKQYSEKVWVTSGVPQGSVLGPLLFIIMMIDADSDIYNAMLSSFADDTRIWKGIDNPETHYLLQEQLNRFYRWAQYNNMIFNNTKFEALLYQTDQPFNYTAPDGSNIDTKQVVKDLGVLMSANGTFDAHIQSTVAAAKRLSHWILRVFHTRNTDPLIKLYKALVLTKLEYACILWSPTSQMSINLLENVQRRFTSRIRQFNTFDAQLGRYICTVSYWIRLRTLNIFSLERRRERYMIIHLYKIIIGLVPNPDFQIREFERTNIKILPKYCKSARPTVKTLRHSSFFSHGPRLYNLLPGYLRLREFIDAPKNTHVDDFKKNLDRFLRRIPDQPTIIGYPRAAISNSILHQIKYIDLVHYQ